MSPFPKHHLIASRLPAIGVAGRISSTEICLNFNNLSEEKFPANLPNENFSQKVFCDGQRGAEVEGAGKGMEGIEVQSKSEISNPKIPHITAGERHFALNSSMIFCISDSEIPDPYRFLSVA